MENRSTSSKLPLILLIVAVLCIVCAVVAALATGDNDKKEPPVATPDPNQGGAGVVIGGTAIPSTPTPEPIIDITPTTPYPINNPIVVSATRENREAGQPIEDTGLILTDVVNYSGEYVEDGSDAYVTEIFAVLLYNDSGRDIGYAELDFITSEGENLNFALSNLPKSHAVLVLDTYKTPYMSWQELTLEGRRVDYTDGLLSHEGILLTDEGNNSLKLSNVSDGDYANLKIYYKHLFDSETYLGGITYTGAVGELRVGSSVAAAIVHFSSGYSEVVAIRDGGVNGG